MVITADLPRVDAGLFRTGDSRQISPIPKNDYLSDGGSGREKVTHVAWDNKPGWLVVSKSERMNDPEPERAMAKFRRSGRLSATRQEKPISAPVIYRITPVNPCVVLLPRKHPFAHRAGHHVEVITVIPGHRCHRMVPLGTITTSRL